MTASELLRCPRTGIPYRCHWPAGAQEGGPAPCAVFFLNGLGLDLEGFQDAVQALDLPWSLPKYPHHHGLHVTLTVPGFEDLARGERRAPLTMIEQARRVAAFMEACLEEHPAREVILYGFSFGSDLAVEVLTLLQGRVPVARALLSELNVHPHSCFISSRIAEACRTASRQPGHERDAYNGFVSRVVKAHAEGRLSATLMQDMALYFRTIARKDWPQLALSAEEASENPEHRLNRLLGLTVDTPGTSYELIFTDPDDLGLCKRRLQSWGGALGRIRVFDATVHEHFHAMGRDGVLESLAGRLREA